MKEIEEGEQEEMGMMYGMKERRLQTMVSCDIMANNLNRKKRAVQKHLSLVAATIYNVCCTNDICIGLMLEAHEALRKSPLYVKETKRLANLVEEKRRRYEREVARIMQDAIGLFAEANDAYNDEEMQRSIQLLYFAFKQEIDRYRVEYSDVVARLELARVMLQYSVGQQQKRREDLRECGIEFAMYGLDSLDMSGIYAMYRRLTDSIRIDAVVDLNTEQCHAAMDGVVKRIMDEERIARAIATVSDN